MLWTIRLRQPQEQWWSLVWNRHLHLRFGSEARPSEGEPIDRIADTLQKELTRKHLYVLLIVSTGCISVLFVGWNYEFPTSIERWLWRAACLSMMIELYVMLPISGTAFVYQSLRDWWRSRRRLPAANCSTTTESKNSALAYPRLPPSKRWQDLAAKVDAFLEHGRNNSPDSDPSLRVHIRFILPMWIMGFIYCVARCYILLADLIEVRSLPPSAYLTVDWEKYWPHLGS